MINFKKIFVSMFLLVCFVNVLACDNNNLNKRHFTLVGFDQHPVSIKSVEAYTDDPNFSVKQTSGNTFDVVNNYDNSKFTSVQLKVMHNNLKKYLFFSDGKEHVQVIQCGGCPRFNKIDANNFEIIYFE